MKPGRGSDPGGAAFTLIPIRVLFSSPGTLDDDGAQQHMLGLLGDVSAGIASTITSYRISRRINNSRTVDPDDATLVDAI